MTAQYQHTFNGNHGIEYTTDKGKKGFIYGILDADTARTLAAGPEAIRILEALLIEVNKEDAHAEGNLLSGIYPVMDKAQELLTNLHASK